MKFNNAEDVQQICWQMRESDWPRDRNRANINSLFNGAPPYTMEEARTNSINVNVNFLEPTRLAHDARMQAQQGILKPGNYFLARTDAGPTSKHDKWSRHMTQTVNRPMKRSLPYYENLRSKIGMNVLHGIGPSCWEDGDVWLPDPLAVEDLLIPASTLLTFKNLPFFAIQRSFTSIELKKIERSTNRDPAWNEELIDQCLAWIDRESMALLGSNWPEVWSPSKVQERIKGDNGLYLGDQVPTIDVWDFFYWSDEDDTEGWRRRIVLDDWSTPASAGAFGPGNMPSGTRNSKVDFGRNQWLYDPGARVYASRRDEIFTCTFADLSSVAPFRYHSVRSLGFLLYAVSHLQNRLRCAFSRSVFESLLMYFKVGNMDEAERALKLELADKGFIDEGLKFVPAAERYQVNAGLVELGLGENAKLINQNASSYSTSTQFGQDRERKTKFQVQAELQQAQTLISAALAQFFTYQTNEYREIFRRFLNPNSRNGDVLRVRAELLKEIPEKYLLIDCWDIDAERTLGAGNKTLEMVQAEQLMQYRPLYDPEAQRKILRDVTLAITDDPGRAEEFVPEQPHISDSIHDTQLAFGTLMQGGKVDVRPGLNNVEVIATMLQLMDNKIKQLGPMGSQADIAGLMNCAQYVQGFIQLLAQDKAMASTARAFSQVLSKLMNLVRAMAQRLQEQQQKMAQAQGQAQNGEQMVKLQNLMAQGKLKQQQSREAHAQKQAHNRLDFEQRLRQDEQKAASDIRHKAAQSEIDLRHSATQNALDQANERAKQRLRSQDEED
jgi:hypothetical protein